MPRSGRNVTISVTVRPDLRVGPPVCQRERTAWRPVVVLRIGETLVYMDMITGDAPDVGKAELAIAALLR